MIAENWSRNDRFLNHSWDKRSEKFTDCSKIGWRFVKIVIKKSRRYNRSHYAGGICQRRFNSENASNVFCPHYTRGIWKRNNHRNFVPTGLSSYRHCTLQGAVRWENLGTRLQSPVILDLCLRETKSGKSRDYRDVIVPEKLRFENASFLTTLKRKPNAFNSSGLKSVFEKFRFRDGLVWTVGL